MSRTCIVESHDILDRFDNGNYIIIERLDPPSKYDEFVIEGKNIRPKNVNIGRNRRVGIELYHKDEGK